MKKRILFTAAVLFSLSAAFPSLAGSWLLGQDGAEVRWWYDNGDGTRAASEWRWIDGDNNGIAECYCFDANGWLLTNTITPDNYTVDLNGAWTVDGIVQTKSTVLSPSQEIENPTLGWQLSGSDWKYYSYGSYLTSQWHKISGKWYYFNADSIMATGFQEIDGELYYFTAKGSLKTRDFTLDGTRYIVEDDGVITESYEIDDSDEDDWETFQSSGKSSTSGSSSSQTADDSPAGSSTASGSDSSSDGSSSSDRTSSSYGGPSDESSDSSGDAYQKPDSFEYSQEEPDSDYRQSSADKYVFDEDE